MITFLCMYLGSSPEGSSMFLSPFFVSTKTFSGFLGTDVIFWTAFVVMKFLVVFNPIRGLSSFWGTLGRLLSSSGYLNSVSVERTKKKKILPAFLLSLNKKNPCLKFYCPFFCKDDSLDLHCKHVQLPIDEKLHFFVCSISHIRISVTIPKTNALNKHG